MEDDSVRYGCELAKLVKGSRNVEVGGCPGVTAASRIPRLGYPELSARNVSVLLPMVNLTAKFCTAVISVITACGAAGSAGEN